MAKKDDMDKLLARESRRRASVVSSIAGIEPEVVEEMPVPKPIVIEETQGEPTAETVIRSVVKPARKETRTVRKQIVITPSLDKKLARKLKANGLSLNEVVHQLLENWADSDV